jgi:hypothetical protein
MVFVICIQEHCSLKTSMNAVIRKKKKPTDLNGKGLERAAAYLKGYVKFPSESATWREIKSIQKIRNAIVHSEGLIKDYDAKKKRHIEEYAEDKSFYLQVKSDTIVLSDAFVIHCLDQFSIFFHELIEIIEP